jgi:hypothetical protein
MVDFILLAHDRMELSLTTTTALGPPAAVEAAKKKVAAAEARLARLLLNRSAVGAA